ncbi:hypothetical protein ACLOJK_018134 [Asimina triloba]
MARRRSDRYRYRFRSEIVPSTGCRAHGRMIVEPSQAMHVVIVLDCEQLYADPSFDRESAHGVAFGGTDLALAMHVEREKALKVGHSKVIFRGADLKDGWILVHMCCWYLGGLRSEDWEYEEWGQHVVKRNNSKTTLTGVGICKRKHHDQDASKQGTNLPTYGRIFWSTRKEGNPTPFRVFWAEVDLELRRYCQLAKHQHVKWGPEFPAR